MKKIGVFTYYGVHNHGALLQAYSLQQTIKNISDYNPVFITFDRDYSYLPKNDVSKYKKSLKSILYYLKYTKKVGLRNILFNLKKNKKLNTFKKTKFLFCKETFSGECSKYVVGSDEVFAVDVGFNPFMYGIGFSKPFFSYAASFGSSVYNDLETKNLCEKIRKGLMSFESISVRDANSFEIVQRLTKRDDLKMVCDPVLLYGFPEILPSPSKNKNKPFILIYSYDKNMNDKDEVKQIKEFAKKNNLMVISVGFYHSWADKNINVDPFELIYWFDSCSFVITDTFHGTVLSILRNKSFVSKIRGNNNKLGFLLSQHNLNNRAIESFNDLDLLYNAKIDFESVNKIVEYNRKQSLDFLKDNLLNEYY